MGLELQKDVDYQLEADELLNDEQTLLVNEFNKTLDKIKSNKVDNDIGGDDIDIINKHLNDNNSKFQAILKLLTMKGTRSINISNITMTEDFVKKYINALGLPKGNIFYNKDGSFTFIHKNGLSDKYFVGSGNEQGVHYIKNGGDLMKLIKGSFSSDPNKRGNKGVVIDNKLYINPWKKGDGWYVNLVESGGITDKSVDIAPILNIDADFFNEGSSEISKDFENDIDFLNDKNVGIIKDMLDKNTEIYMYIDGFTNINGDSNNNMYLSEARAKRIKELMSEKLGENYSNRIKFEGHGETKAFDNPEKSDSDNLVLNRTVKINFFTEDEHNRFINDIKNKDNLTGENH